MKKLLALTLSLVLGLALLAGCAGEKKGDLLAEIQEKGEIVVAMEGTWAPWTYMDEDGDLVGYDVEVAGRAGRGPLRHHGQRGEHHPRPLG